MFYTIPSMATWIPGPRAVMHRNEKEIYLLRYVQVQKNFLKKHLGCRINCIFFSCNVLYCILYGWKKNTMLVSKFFLCFFSPFFKDYIISSFKMHTVPICAKT